MLVAGDKVADLGLELTRQIVVLGQDVCGAERLTPSLNPTLCLRMMRLAAGVAPALPEQMSGHKASTRKLRNWLVRRIREICRKMALQLRNKTPKRQVKAKLPDNRKVATRPNETWAMNFVHDQLANHLHKREARHGRASSSYVFNAIGRASSHAAMARTFA
jgi:hypothetical protein